MSEEARVEGAREQDPERCQVQGEEAGGSRGFSCSAGEGQRWADGVLRRGWPLCFTDKVFETKVWSCFPWCVWCSSANCLPFIENVKQSCFLFSGLRGREDRRIGEGGVSAAEEEAGVVWGEGTVAARWAWGARTQDPWLLGTDGC